MYSIPDKKGSERERTRRKIYGAGSDDITVPIFEERNYNISSLVFSLSHNFKFNIFTQRTRKNKNKINSASVVMNKHKRLAFLTRNSFCPFSSLDNPKCVRI